MVETTSIGVKELDKSLMNGVPKGYTILVTGTPGTGVELFAKQFAAAGIGKENVRVCPAQRLLNIQISIYDSFGSVFFSGYVSFMATFTANEVRPVVIVCNNVIFFYIFNKGILKCFVSFWVCQAVSTSYGICTCAERCFAGFK